MNLHSKRIYLFLKLTIWTGIILPLLTCFLKLCADNFLVWKRVKSKIPQVENLTDNYPILDIERYEFLSAISWHHPYGLHVFEYYIRYASFAFLLLLILRFYKKRIKKYLSKIDFWLSEQNYSGTRKFIVITCCALFFSYVVKIPIGFYWPGVSGWTYQSKTSGLIEKLPPEVNQLEVVPDFIVNSINIDAFIPDNFRGFLKGKSMFLHFSDGQTLPFNYGLTGYVFPRYQFGKELKEYQNQDVLFATVKHGLEKSQKNTPYLLPESISYPRHSVYMHIDYSKYPPPDELQSISFWDVWIRISNNKKIHPVSATQQLTLKDNENHKK